MSIEVLEFDTAELPPERRFAAWASAMPFYKVEAEDPATFAARIRSWIVPPIVVVDAEVSAVRSVRTADQVRGDANDDLIVRLLVDTTQTGEAPNRSWIAHPGHIACHDRGQPLDSVMTGGRSITLSFPRAFLDDRILGADVHGAVLDGGIARLLHATLSALPDMLTTSAPNSAELARLLRDLVAATVRDAGRAGRQTADDAALKSRLRRHIANNLARPQSVEALCTDLGVSRSSLYRALASEGGIAKYVQSQRLSRLYRILCDPLERRSIDELARTHGFADSAHFSRLFRRTYGESASSLRRRVAARRASQPAAAGGPQGAPSIFNNWEASRTPVQKPDHDSGTQGQF